MLYSRASQVHYRTRWLPLPQTINVFSYGSGCASTMFRLTVDALPGFKEDMHEYLDQVQPPHL